MKSQKLLLIAAIVCLLVGASGTAMARNDCPDGRIVGGTFEEIVIDEFVECMVVGVTVEKGVRVVNADDFTMIASKISGNVTVENTVATALVKNEIYAGIFAKGNGFTIVYQNVVDGGNISVDDIGEQQQEVVVSENQVFGGSLLVYGNKTADVKDNNVRAGNIGCYDNDRLDSFFNHAVFGTVDCKD
jgi:hypothetical protein